MAMPPSIPLPIITAVAGAVAGAVVGAAVGFAFNVWLTSHNQRHERRLAVFNAELEDVTAQFNRLGRAFNAMMNYYWTLEDLHDGVEGYGHQDKIDARKEALSAYRDLRTAVLTTSSALEREWCDFQDTYADLLEKLKRPEGNWREAVAADKERFDNQYDSLTARLREGLERFQRGGPIFPA